ncbi:MAG: long-chain acyl-CoA synthetase [Nocardioidaceae bacterium]|jgi:long-chain acyl-CoA synthetase|nr:long-chain acyl-CoA synthetase [Nocardioidaceae bacterium]
MSASTAITYDLAVIENRAPNVGRQFFDRVQASADREAYRYPVGDGWESRTWRETGDQVTRLAAGLVALGVQPEQRVGIAAGTRLEWILADLAIMSAGAATTTVYPSTNTSDVGFILADSQCRVVFAEDDEQIAKLAEHRSALPELGTVVTFDGTPDGDWVLGLEDLQRLGDDLLVQNAQVVQERIDATGPDSLATLIYTSGTTGRPKGVRLRHASWTYEGAAVQALGILDETDLQFLWLPMAHAFGKVLLSAQLACGFATAVDGRVDKIIDNLAVVRPTFMGAAPRIFEKAYSRIVTMQASEGGLKERLFKRAFEVGLEVDRHRREGRPVPFLLARQHAVYDRLVFAKVRQRFGGRVRFFISGAAALNREIAEWFHAAGILILEGYGLTETSAGSAVNHPDEYRIGSVGLVLPGTEVRIAEDGEILLNGPGVMEGYHNKPDESAATLTEDGWLHTGDIGEVDAEGFLRITDRKKDLFKTSGGKYVAPSVVESQFKAISPYASQFVLFGNERKYCVALISLDPDAIAGWAQENGMSGRSYADVVASPQVHEMVGRHVDTLNERLNRWETVKKWALLDHDLTVESGELTPSLKVRRKVVEDNHRDEIERMYA